MSIALYYIVLLAAVALAIWRGGRWERWAAYTAVIGSVATTLIVPRPEWREVEYEIFAIDLVVLAGFWVAALKTQRFWPYWITGWQLIAVFGHLQKLMFPEILPAPYALLSMYISYPILFVILYASGSNKRKADIGI